VSLCQSIGPGHPRQQSRVGADHSARLCGASASGVVSHGDSEEERPNVLVTPHRQSE
jgi:hypothetical protein